MLFTITTTHKPATDLGYLLGKNPARCQSFPLAFGQAHVFYPEASDERCTAALLVDLDPIGLVRGWRGPAGETGTLGQYVNDRPYVASSFLSVAIARVYGTALHGASKERPELAETPIPLTVELPVVPCRGGEGFLRRLFEPLGYTVTAERLALDPRFPEWGESPYFRVTLKISSRLQDLLQHIYVLLPVLDDDKHYWVGRDELEKLLARGEGWLATHPAREQIITRYLRHRRRLAQEALARLLAQQEANPDIAGENRGQEEEALEKPIRLQEQRLDAVVAVLKDSGAKRVLDLGCGEGHLLQELVRNKSYERVAGMDVSHRALEIAAERLNLDRMSERERERIELFQGALTYRDTRLAGYDAACAMEVVEYLDESRVPAFERVLFEFARPGIIVLTTPNREFNVRFPALAGGGFRHGDHRFEWSRAEFSGWAQRVATRFGYNVSFSSVGAEDESLGPPTQMAVFKR